jgi:hypothetical protein
MDFMQKSEKNQCRCVAVATTPESYEEATVSHSFPGGSPDVPRTPLSCHTSSEANRRGQLSGRYPKSSQKLLARSRRQVGP